MLVGWKRISAAMILSAATAGVAQAQTANQATADAVARSLQGSRSLAGYRIEIETSAGTATLTGVVATPAQKAEAIARAQRAPGVTGVVDRLSVGGADRVLPAQYQLPNGPAAGPGGMVGGDDVIYDGDPAPAMGGPAAAAGAVMPDGPLPEGPAVMSGAMRTASPAYPNYAWPSYAPYPNFSAVGYPTIYPWQAFPNIGPFYPYPEPPLDWRAVTANYKDGTWQLKFRKNYTRPFIMVWPFADIFNRNY
jgi:hypothetical protein